VCDSLLLRSCPAQEPSSNSAQIAESYERLPKQRVEVTGSCLLTNFNSLMPRYILIFCLVLRAVNVPSIKKCSFFKRKHYVTVSNADTTAKTADVRVGKQMAQWNQNLDPLYVFPPPSNVMPKSFVQSCTTVFASHNLSLCEAVCTSRHPYRDP
jgi:hypothetical protein